MQFLSFLPHPVLQDFIHFYWVGNLFLTAEEELNVSVQPITMQNLLFFPESSPFRINNGHIDKMASCTLIGMISRPSAYLLKGHIKIIGVRFKPIGFSSLFAVPPKDFTNHASDFRLTFKLEMDELCEKIQSHASDQIRIKILEDYFKNKLKQRSSASVNQKAIQWAINKIELARGNLRVNQLAQEVFISERHFRRIFLETTGLNPKEFAEIIRYNEAYKLILNSPQKDWFDIIHKCGYHDQSHFIYDFKKFTGSNPTQYESNFRDFDSFHR